MDMNHLIGQRFNLISKSEIRYVGTLHEINPEASTIALENVQSFGTEGRRKNPAEEVPASSTVYEYIVFRGSDVSDISIAEEETKDNTQPEPPRVPDDPAILGNMSRSGPVPNPPMGSSAPGLPPQPASQPPQGAQQTPPGYPPQQPFPQQGFYPPYGQRFNGPPPPFPPGPGGPGGFPGNMPYGAPPPGWFPPPGHGFPPGGPGQFPPQMPHGAPAQPPQQRPGPPGVPTPQTTSELPGGDQKPASRNATPAAQKAPTPPVESKPTVAEAVHGSGAAAAAQKSGRVIPAVPMAAPRPVAPAHSVAPVDATAAASQAVAAAMAKLPQPGAQKKPSQDASVDALSRKMNDMQPYGGPRAPRGGHQQHQQHQHSQHQHSQHQHPRGGRGGVRAPPKKIEVPESDYDFATANAKFNKQDLIKEAIATGSPAADAESHDVAHQPEAEVNGTAAATSHNLYNRSNSFFDNISSEARDREENANRVGGREWRGEEEKRNIETFGQGSVDGYRGRGCGGYGRGGRGGRGYGGRGRGFNNSRGYGGRGGSRGGRAPSQSTGVPSQV
ncbi:Protein sum2 [Penicillium rolfsii]|nr:Protein sum2 [Penicillium rolfsii]